MYCAQGIEPNYKRIKELVVPDVGYLYLTQN
jgi:hypothetical protein